MYLSELWANNPDQLKGKTLEQIIKFSGGGELRDNSETSAELREFLAHIPSEMLADFADQCLSSSFKDSGLALQDIVNKIGSRLGFKVEDGRYRGVKNAIGFDGLWQSTDGKMLVIEVKTTDTYSINIDIPASYRQALISERSLNEDATSILFVVGRQDTGNLEAQIRGSRHAWDIRMISVDALLKLLRLKEGLEDPLIVQKIVTILSPQEYTKVDGIVDVVFLTAEDIGDEEEEVEIDDSKPGNKKVKKVKFHPVAFHEECVDRIKPVLNRNLIRQSKGNWQSPEEDLALLCLVSREHQKSSYSGYWFAFHPHQKEFLEGAKDSFVAFGCGSSNKIFLIPFQAFSEWIEGLNTTETDDRTYWHVHIREQDGKYSLTRKQGFDSVSLSEYLL